MKILVIGGSGHVSGAVVRAALAEKHQVWTITRGNRPLPKEVRTLIVDRHNFAAMRTAIAGEKTFWDLVVDCICYEPVTMREDIELFRHCAGRFVFISTELVYDPALRRFPQPEDSPYLSSDGDGTPGYGYKKRACELELINGDTNDMNWTILRPCHIYGPNSELGCLPLHGRDPELIAKMRAGIPLKLVGGGHFLQQPVLADDLAGTIIGIAGNNNIYHKIFNMAGPDIIESRQYYQIIADILGVELTIEEVPVASYFAKNPDKGPFLCHRIYDLSRLRAAGLMVPSTSIAEGLRYHVEGLLARNIAG